MKKLLCLFILIATIATTGCTSMQAKDQSRNNEYRENRKLQVTAFSGVNAGTGVEVRIVVGNSYKAVASGTPDALNHLDFSQAGEMLNISMKGSGNFSPVKVTLTAPYVNTVFVSSGAEVKIADVMDIPNRDMTVRTSSGAEVDISGVSCKTLNLTADSGSEIDIVSLKASTINMVTGSGADIDLNTVKSPVFNLKSDSGADISVKDLDTDALNIVSDSGSEVEIDNIDDADSVNVRAESGADVKLAGRTTSVVFTASTAHIKAYRLAAQNGKATATTAATIQMNVSGRFNYSADQTSTVRNRHND